MPSHGLMGVGSICAFLQAPESLESFCSPALALELEGCPDQILMSDIGPISAKIRISDYTELHLTSEIYSLR